MKTHLLLLLMVSLMSLPMIQAQLLTPIPDSTRYSDSEESKSNYYLAVGYTVRVDLGHRQMRDFYETQGFDVYWAQELLNLGAGIYFWDDFHFSLGVDHSFHYNNPEDIELPNDHTLSLHERKLALNVLLGYRFWQQRHKSLLIHAGYSYLQSRAEIVERRPQNFDFSTANINVPEGVRSWPIFLHRQGALHVALQLKLRYPKPRWWSTDVDVKLGFVSGLNTKAWSVEPGQALNVPIDRAQFLYISSTYHFFSRQ